MVLIILFGASKIGNQLSTLTPAAAAETAAAATAATTAAAAAATAAAAKGVFTYATTLSATKDKADILITLVLVALLHRMFMFWHRF